jgi:ribonuclease T1
MGLSVAVAMGAGLPAAHARAQESQIERVAVGTIAVADLPAAGQTTIRQIERGGPFSYAKDGSVFGNRERLLPAQGRGYYREYTVRTPGSRDRGARRIICGGALPTRPDACFYTDDHYASFRRILQ